LSKRHWLSLKPGCAKGIFSAGFPAGLDFASSAAFVVSGKLVGLELRITQRIADAFGVSFGKAPAIVEADPLARRILRGEQAGGHEHAKRDDQHPPQAAAGQSRHGNSINWLFGDGRTALSVKHKIICPAICPIHGPSSTR
jgi:prepilin-type processing-associated H-X9-DG protein